jgi:hypothetical protein
MLFTSLRCAYFSGTRDFEALFGTAFGFHLGHLAFPFRKKLWRNRCAKLSG